MGPFMKQPNAQSLLDKKNIEQIRQQAKTSVESGAVTADYPLDLTEACNLLNSALATEILCVLRYRHHQIIAKGINYLQVADEFREHAEEEELHMMMIAERINQLGGNPDFNPQAVINKTLTEYGKGTSLPDMIKEDLIAERAVISFYRKLIEWFQADSTTRTMLEHILKDEEHHADELGNLLASKQH